MMRPLVQWLYQFWTPSVKATSHMRPKATSSTLIGGKRGAGPSSLHTMLEGPTEQDGCKVYMDPYMASNGSFFMVTRTIFPKPSLGDMSSTKPGDYGTPKSYHPLFIIFYHVRGLRMSRNTLKMAFGWRSCQIWLHTTLEGPWPNYVILEVSWDSFWTLLGGSHKFHGHGSWFMCGVALGNVRNVRNVPSWCFPMIVLQTLCMKVTQIS